MMLEDPCEVDHLLKAMSVDMSNRIVNHKEFDRGLFDLCRMLTMQMALMSR